MIVTVSFDCLFTTSLLLAMNQLFCVAAIPSFRVLVPLSGATVDAFNASAFPGPRSCYLLILVAYGSLEFHSTRIASIAAMFELVFAL